jgi:hypothetical protein
VPETKEDIAAERDQLREEVARLQGELAAAGRPAPGPVAPAHTFELSEGDRQELVIRGQINVGGRMRSRQEIKEMLGENQRNVDLGNAEPPAAPAEAARQGVPGVDFVYPSVEPGGIDPAVAGTPGISGPPAGR